MLNTDRRSLLIALPAITVAAAIPMAATASPSTDAGWQAALAVYRAAVKREDEAGYAHNELEEAMIENPIQPAPTRDIRYTIDVDGKSFDAIHRVHPSDCDDPTSGIADNPVFDSYREEVATWREKTDQWRASLNADAIEKEWEDAVDDRVDAWRALAGYPAPTVAVMAEKAAYCGADETRECDGCHDLLIQSLAADAKRLSGGQLQ